MRKFLSITIIALMTMFLLGGVPNVLADNQPRSTLTFPDTSYCEGSLLNVADVGDQTKYKAIHGVTVANGMSITYHESIGDIYPKYVSLLWRNMKAIGFVYYDKGVFYVWMRKAPYDSLFRRVGESITTQQAFQIDFEKLWKGLEFPLSTSS